MALLKSKKTKYEFSPDEIKKLIANDMEIPLDAVSVEYVLSDIADDRFSTIPDYQVTKIEVTIDETKIK